MFQVLIFRICKEKSQFTNFTWKLLGAVLMHDRVLFSCSFYRRFSSTVTHHYRDIQADGSRVVQTEISHSHFKHFYTFFVCKKIKFLIRPILTGYVPCGFSRIFLWCNIKRQQQKFMITYLSVAPILDWFVVLNRPYYYSLAFNLSLCLIHITVYLDVSHFEQDQEITMIIGN